MNAEQLVGRYLAGAITSQHLFMELLRGLDPACPEPVLSAIPSRLLYGFARFLDEFRHGAMVSTIGVLPADDQVEAAAKWLARSSHRVGA